MNNRIILPVLVSMWLLLMFPSCGKDWLEEKPDKSLVVPTTIEDLQLLLDNTTQTFNVNQSSGLGEIGAGDFYITVNSWNSLFNAQEKSAYIWEQTSDFYKGETSIDWENGYRRILNANVVLYGIDNIQPLPAEQQSWRNVKGSALFFRAFDFYNLAQQYCRPFVAGTATAELGLPLRISYDVNIALGRATLQETYSRIVLDLKAAAGLLGITPLFKTRPSKQAAYAMLARAYLSMEMYDQALLYADSALQIQSTLLDYNKISHTAAVPFSRFNNEVIFHSTFTYGIFNSSRLIVQPELYADYAEGDRRKVLYFVTNANGVTFKGHYSGDRTLFGGLATDELYLVRAECYARKGDMTNAQKDLNQLLKSRWDGSFQAIALDNQDALLNYILKERRKELLLRGLRWTDLRRLNRDSRFAVALRRTLDGQSYTLMPNDKRYVFPIDEQELRLSGIQQNDR